MITIIQSLRAISAYPIPEVTLLNAIESNGLDAETGASVEIRESNAYKLAMASVYTFLSIAPNISQGGVSYSFTTAEKNTFKAKAASLIAESGCGVGYGWQGEDF